MTNIRRLAITTGEPAGIGPDLVLMLAMQDHCAQWIAIGCPIVLQKRANTLKLPITIVLFDASKPRSPQRAGQLFVLPIATKTNVDAGVLNHANAPYVLQLLDHAIDGCMNKVFDAMITAPLQKSIINDAGIPFTGHTEYLAQATNTKQVVMMLATESLRVALVTNHLPLAQVPQAITMARLCQVTQVVHRELKATFGITQQRLVMTGLNPHAGEQGHLGTEEIDTIIPAIRSLQAQRIDVQGPLPADTAFTPKYLDHCDAVIAMYHDQGLPTLKYAGFGNAVNITLGLPFMRVSVDHGTALSLAGTGAINTGSLQAAIACAMKDHCM